MVVGEKGGDLMKMSCDLFEGKVESLMAQKKKLRKYRNDREKAISNWEKRLLDFVSWLSNHLREKNERVYESHQEKMSGITESLTYLNKELLHLFQTPTTKKSLIDEKIEDMQQIQWDSDFSGDFDFILLKDPIPQDNNNKDQSPITPEIAQAFVDSSNFNPEELSFLNVICWGENPLLNASTMAPTATPSPNRSSAFKNNSHSSNGGGGATGAMKHVEGVFTVEDSFYANKDNAVMGVHFLGDHDDEILKAKKDSVDALNKSDLNMINSHKDENMKAKCNTCGQPMSVLLQLNLAQEKANRSQQNPNIFTNLLVTPNQALSREGSRKNVSFFQRTTIVEEELSKEGMATPKFSSGQIKLDENSEIINNRRQSCINSRAKLNMSSPPLKGDLVIDESAKHKIDGGILEEVDESSPEKILKMSNCPKPKSSFEGDPKLVCYLNFKYDKYNPTSIAKEEKFLFVCSPTLNKVAVLDLLSNHEIGYLKVPELGYDGCRNVVTTHGRVIVLDNKGLHIFHSHGTFEKSLFTPSSEIIKSQNLRGLAVKSIDQLLTLEKNDKGDINLVSLDLINEIVIKRILIKSGSEATGLMCRFLSYHSESSTVIISDMNSGKIIHVNYNHGVVKEINSSGVTIGKGTGVCFDEIGRFAIGDMENKKIQIFDNDGKWLKTLSLSHSMTPPSGNNKMILDLTPTGILLDGSHLFVADNNQHCIYKFTMI